MSTENVLDRNAYGANEIPVDHTRSVIAPPANDKLTADGKFEYKGMTVFYNPLSEDEWKAISATEKGLRDTSAKAKEELEAVEDEVSCLNNQRLEARRKSTDVKLFGEIREALSAANKKRDEIATQMEEISSAFAKFHRDIVKKAVVGWKDYKQPFSEQAIDGLPMEYIADWVGYILEKSRLGTSAANF